MVPVLRQYFARRPRLVMLGLFALAMALPTVAAFAQTPEPAMTSSEFVTAAQDLITSFGLMAIIVATAIISLAAYLLRRVRSASR